MSIVKKAWITGMVAIPVLFFCAGGFSLELLSSGPFYGLVLLLSGFPLSGFSVHFYSSVVHDVMFQLALPSYESAFMLYQEKFQWLVVWVFAFCAGYIQWFVCLPWLWRQAKRMKHLTRQ